MFSGLLSSDEASFLAEARQSIADELGAQWAAVSLNLDDGEDVAPANLEGNGALEVAERWADDGKMRRKLKTLLQYLDGPERESVERLLHGPAYVNSQGEGETQDVWNEVSAGPAAVEVEKPRVEERGFDGRATREQTEQAMARLRAGFEKPSARAQPDSDEETESGDEDAHMRTAHFFFASYVDMPSQLPDPNAASSSPIRVVTDDERVVSPTAAPVAEPCLRVTSALLPPSATAGKHCDSAEHNPQIPHLPHQAALGCPFQLLSPAPSTRKRCRSGQDQGSAPGSQNAKDAAASLDLFEPTLKERTTPRLTDPQKQPSTRTPSRSAVPPAPSQDSAEREPKRRRIAKDQEIVCRSPDQKTDCVPQDKLSIAFQAPSSPQAFDRTDTEAFTMICLPGESNRTLVALPKAQDRQSRSAIRANMAKQLGVIAPNLVRGPYIAKMELSPERSDSLLEVLETQEAEDDMRLPDELPSSDSQVSTDIEIDMERSQAMMQAFKEKYAQGFKPVEVIPRLQCLGTRGD